MQMAHLVNERSSVFLRGAPPLAESLCSRWVNRLSLKDGVVTDSRVSRNHALLQLKDGNFSICPKHENPCFYKAARDTDYVMLQRGQWKDLKFGDVISLLPKGEIAFRISGKPQESSTAAPIPSSQPSNDNPDPHTTRPAPPTSTSPAPPTSTPPLVPSGDAVDDLLFGDVPPPVPDQGNSKISTADKNPPEHQHTSEEEDSSKMECGLAADNHEITDGGDEIAQKPDSPPPSKPVGSTNKKRVLPSWLSGIPITSSSTSSFKASSKKPPSSTQRPKAAAAATTSKRKASRRSESPDKAKPPPPKKAAVRRGAKRTPSVSRDAPSPAPLDPDDEEVKEKKLPLCPYGAKCYRKNPAHFREYSHNFSAAESDGEEEEVNEADKPVCPYGASCYRKNPAHHKEYAHPPARPAKGRRHSTRTTKGKKKQSVVAGASDDDGEPNTYDYEDSFIDDDKGSSSSAYSTDDSDWMPGDNGGGAGPGGGGGGGEDEGEEEDVSELVADAKKFMRNKKMRR